MAVFSPNAIAVHFLIVKEECNTISLDPSYDLNSKCYKKGIRCDFPLLHTLQLASTQTILVNAFRETVLNKLFEE